MRKVKITPAIVRELTQSRVVPDDRAHISLCSSIPCNGAIEAAICNSPVLLQYAPGKKHYTSSLRQIIYNNNIECIYSQDRLFLNSPSLFFHPRYPGTDAL